MSNNKTPIYKKVWFLVVVGVVLFLGIGFTSAVIDTANSSHSEQAESSSKDDIDYTSDDDSSDDDSYSEDSESSSSESESSSSESSSSEKTSSSDDSSALDDDSEFDSIKDYPKSERLSAAVSIIKRNFSSIADVEYDSETKSIQIIPKSTDVTAGAVEANATGDTDDWDDMTSSIDTLSVSLHDDLGLDNPIMIMNSSSNDDRVLYAVKNGKTLYDYTTDSSDDN